MTALCRDDRCRIDELHAAHRIKPGPGRPTGNSGPTKRQRLSRRRRRHARKIAKLKAQQAANNRKILLGRR